MLADMERTKTLLVGGWLADWLVPLGLLQEVLSQRPLESSLDYVHARCMPVIVGLNYACDLL